MCSGPLLGDVPVHGQQVEVPDERGSDRQQRHAVLAGDPRPRRRGDRGDADLEAGVRERPQLAAGVDQPVARRRDGDRLVAAQQVDEDGGVLLERLALFGRLDADHRRVRGQRAGSEAEHEAAAGEMVEQDRPVRHPQRVVVRQRQDAGAELDVPGLGGDVGDEDLRRGDDLGAARVVLADPGLVVTEVVELADRRHVARDRRRRVLAGRRMERRHEDAEAKSGH